MNAPYETPRRIPSRSATSASPCRTIPASSTSRARRNTSTTSASPRARCMSPSANRRRRAGDCSRSMSRPCAPCPASSRCSPPPTSPARTTCRRPSATIRCSSSSDISFHGQALFAVVATDRDIARRAARLARDRDRSRAPSITVEDALERGETVLPDYAFGRGDAGCGDRAAPHRARRRGSASAGRSISISKARSRWRSRARTATSTSIPRRSIRPKCSMSWRACSAFPMPM